MQFDTRSNVPDDSTYEDKYLEGTGRIEGGHEISQGKAATTALNTLQLTL